MNNSIYTKTVNILETLFSIGYDKKISYSSLEKRISISKYFISLEKNRFYYSIFYKNNIEIINEILFDISLKEDVFHHYNQTLWCAEAYMYLFKNTHFTFEALFLYFPLKEMYRMFPIYHEMDFTKLTQRLNILIKEKSILRVILESRKISLKELSTKTNISVDTLSSFKYQRRDITKLDAYRLILLSDALYVRPETLLISASKINS